MDNKPVISVIIPTYNRAHFLGETLDSLRNSIFEKWECLIIDDGSSDYTEELMEFYCERDLRFSFYKRPATRLKGANSCRNIGLEISKGDFIQWFDSDDIFHPEKLLRQLSVLTSDKSLDICVCEYGLYDKNLNFIKKNSLETTDLLIDYLTQKAPMNLQTTLFRKTTLSGFFLDEGLQKAQEYEFFSRFLYGGGIRYHILNQEMVKIRMHSENITSSFFQGSIPSINSEMKARLNGIKIIKRNGQEDDLKVAIFHYCHSLHQVLKQRKIFLFEKFSFLIIWVAPKSYFWSLLKLALFGNLFLFSKRGLSHIRSNIIGKI